MKRMFWHEGNLFLEVGDKFMLYSDTPYAQTDYLIKGGTKGYRTYQHLLNKGWTTINYKETNM